MSSTYNARKILIESLPILAVVLVLALLTGTLLNSQLTHIVPYFPFILLIIPAFINVSGDLAGVVGARVTSHLFTGQLDKNFRPFRLLASNLVGVVLVALTAYAFLALCVIGISYLLLHTLLPQYILPFFFAILGAGVLATVCTSLLGLLGARIVYRSGRDPDSIIPPLTTTVGDLLGILFVTLALLAIVV
ncbi:MAG: magnesium transporter [Promethearchaeota archaeon]